MRRDLSNFTRPFWHSLAGMAVASHWTMHRLNFSIAIARPALRPADLQLFRILVGLTMVCAGFSTACAVVPADALGLTAPLELLRALF